MTDWRLNRCSGPVRALCTGFLLTAAAGLCVSLLHVHAAMGGTNAAAIATTLRGPANADAAAAEFAEEFGAAGGTDFGRSYEQMLQTAHTHSLSIPLLFLALGGIFLGTSLTDRLKTIILALSFVSIALDLGGLWLTRYVSAGFALPNVLTGIVMCACAGVLIGRSLWDLWRRPARRADVAPPR